MKQSKRFLAVVLAFAMTLNNFSAIAYAEDGPVQEPAPITEPAPEPAPEPETETAPAPEPEPEPEPEAVPEVVPEVTPQEPEVAPEAAPQEPAPAAEPAAAPAPEAPAEGEKTNEALTGAMNGGIEEPGIEGNTILQLVFELTVDGEKQPLIPVQIDPAAQGGPVPLTGEAKARVEELTEQGYELTWYKDAGHSVKVDKLEDLTVTGQANQRVYGAAVKPAAEDDPEPEATPEPPQNAGGTDSLKDGDTVFDITYAPTTSSWLGYGKKTFRVNLLVGDSPDPTEGTFVTKDTFEIEAFGIESFRFSAKSDASNYRLIRIELLGAHSAPMMILPDDSKARGDGDAVRYIYDYSGSGVNFRIRPDALGWDFAGNPATMNIYLTKKEVAAPTYAITQTVAAAPASPASMVSLAAADEIAYTEGMSLQYTVKVQNTGSVTINGLALSNTHNAEMTLTDANGATFANGKLSGLEAGRTATLTYTRPVEYYEKTVPCTVTGQIEGVEEEPQRVDTPATIADHEACEVVVTVTDDEGSPVGTPKIGQTLHYTVKVVNKGNVPLNDKPVTFTVNGQEHTGTVTAPVQDSDEFVCEYTVQSGDEAITTGANVGDIPAELPPESNGSFNEIKTTIKLTYEQDAFWLEKGPCEGISIDWPENEERSIESDGTATFKLKGNAAGMSGALVAGDWSAYYKLQGWKDKDSGQEYGWTAKVDHDITVVPIWPDPTIIRYHSNYPENGGKVEEDLVTYGGNPNVTLHNHVYNETEIVPYNVYDTINVQDVEAVTGRQYEFKGWSTTPEGTEMVPADQTWEGNTGKQIDLYAIWEEIRQVNITVTAKDTVQPYKGVEYKPNDLIDDLVDVVVQDAVDGAVLTDTGLGVRFTDGVKFDDYRDRADGYWHTGGTDVGTYSVCLNLESVEVTGNDGEQYIVRNIYTNSPNEATLTIEPKTITVNVTPKDINVWRDAARKSATINIDQAVTDLEEQLCDADKADGTRRMVRVNWKEGENGKVTWTGDEAEDTVKIDITDRLELARLNGRMNVEKNYKATLKVAPVRLNLYRAGAEITEVKLLDKPEDGFKAGDLVKIQLTLRNTGNIDLKGVTANFQKLKNTYGVLLMPCVNNLAAGETASATATYKVTQADIDAGLPLTDSLKLKANSDNMPEGLANWSLNVESAPTVIVPLVAQAPALTVEAVPNMTGQAAKGDTIYYTVTVKNSGNVTLNNISLTSEGFAKYGNRHDATALFEGDTTSKSIERLEVGQAVTYTAAYTVKGTDLNPAGKNGHIQNTFTAACAHAAEPVTAEAAAKVYTAKVSDTFEAKVDAVRDGDTITYTFTITNTGDRAADSFHVYDEPEGILAWSEGPKTGRVESGATVILTATHKLTEADLIEAAGREGEDKNQYILNFKVNSQYSEGLGGKSNPSQPLTSKADVADLTAPDLTVNVTADKTSGVDLGGVVKYTYTVTNTGKVTVTDITLTDGLDGARVVTNSPIRTMALGTPGMRIASLAPGESYRFELEYAVKETDILAGHIINNVAATGKSALGNVEEDDTHSVTPAEVKSDLEVTSSVEAAPDTVQVGDTVTYNYTVQNTGNVTLHNVQITDAFGHTHTVDSLAPGATVNVPCSHTVTAENVASGTLTNTVTATGNAPSGEAVESEDKTATDFGTSAPLDTNTNKHTVTINYVDEAGRTIYTTSHQYYEGETYTVAGGAVYTYGGSEYACKTAAITRKMGTADVAYTIE